MSALTHLYIASVKEFMRDRMALFWTLAFPILFIFIFGIVFSGGDDPSYPVGLAIEDEGPAGQALAEVFQSIEAFEVTTGRREELVARLEEGDYRLVVVIPATLSADLAARRPAEVEVIYDPTNTVTAQVVLTITEKVVDGFDRQRSNSPTLLSIAPIPVTSDRLRTIDFFIPGILGMALMQLGLFGTAPALVQLREQQVLRRIGATPLPRTTLLASQVLMRLTIGAIQTILILVVGILLFDVTIVGNLLLLAGFAFLGALMFVAMGYMISGLAKTQESVTGITSLLNFPMMFLSGLFFPVEVMPAWIRPVVNAIPLTYLADALRQIMVGAPPVYGLGLDALVLAAWLLVCAVLAVRFFRWE
ncbi:MAG: ABC transporter permease [Chloroflexi bacterium]|nr:ABC transporter permease [Chloroflexota bacterium]MCI0577489.1 ABC transporter permease [Chloroflexota bacterium]MCI0647680.1 ABC transporter permease [Chloroflexota bacterium]MCI0730110.1 ABC transporter permease [Chloroflexota bacterium]